jgi:hypothetical protein
MGLMSDDDRMDGLLRQMAADEYNRPPHIVPREQMWDAVQQGLREGRGTGDEGRGRGAGISPIARIPRWVYLAVAAVLLLAVGIQVGRVLGPAGTAPPLAANPDSLGRDTAAARIPGPDASPRQDIARVDQRSDDKGRPPRPGPRPEPERQVGPDLGDDGASRAYSLVAVQHLVQVEALLTSFKGDLNQGRMDAQIASWGKELLSNTRLLLDSPVAADPVRRKLLQDLELVLVQIVQLSPGASARDRDLIKGALTDDQVLTRLRTAIPSTRGT